MANDEMLNEFPKGCFNPGYYNDPGHQDFTKPITQWQPEDGEWIIHRVRDGFNDYSESLAIYHASSNIVPIRPARLDDFAVTIDGLKYWFVIMKDKRTFAYSNGLRVLTFNPIYPTDLWLIQGAIAHYNITVLDEATFKKLSEADNV